MRRTVQLFAFAATAPRLGKHRGQGRRQTLDDLFGSRAEFNAAAAEDRQRTAGVGTADDGVPVHARLPKHMRTSRPVTFLDEAPEAAGDASLVDPATVGDALEAAQDSAVAAAASDGPLAPSLLDDDFTYFPAARTEADAAVVPGEDIVPPGLRRYRVDLQYRGDHYFGWDRAAATLHPGGQQQAPHRSEAQADAVAMLREKRAGPIAAAGAGVDVDDAMRAGHRVAAARSAKDALDDALTVALDVRAGVTTVPSTILEAGVHARRLVCHVDVPADATLQPRTVLQRAHVWLQRKGDPMAVLSFQPAPRGFHARHAALRRVYCYRIANRVAPPLFDLGRQWHVDRALDVDAMNAAAAHMEGTRDYGALADYKMARTLARAGAAATTRTVERLHVQRQEDEVLVWAVGRSFLRHHIRNAVGALVMAGKGAWHPDDVAGLMQRGFRASPGRAGPPIAPAHGLALWDVEYRPEHSPPRGAPLALDSGPLPSDNDDFGF